MGIEVRGSVPLAALTTFGIGGNARHFVEVRSDDEVRDALRWAAERNMRFVVLGGGSNVLVPDEGLDALVIRFVGDLYSFAGGSVDSWGGTNLLFLIRAMGTQGQGGWEKLAGIPGSLGGAVRGNAGAFGSEIKDFVVSVRALNSQTGEVREFGTAECDFSYRHSFFKEHPEWIILRSVLRLTATDAAESKRLADLTVTEREHRHLQNVKAAGSYFMNPKAPEEVVALFEKEKGVRSREGRVPAGWLIEKAGMKGARVGDAIASLQHPNYLVNDGNATAEQIKQLAQTIRREVESHFGVQLSEEAAML